MAKYDVTYTCGHTGVINLVGPGRDRQWRLDREEEKLCYNCYQEKLKRDREEANAQAAADNQEAGLPALEGTENQIAWAETIRCNFLKLLTVKASGVTEEHKAAHPDKWQELQDIIRSFKSRTAAHWWIDNRESLTDNPYDLSKMLEKELAEIKKAAIAPPAAVIEEAQAEATVYPLNAVSNLVTDIEVQGNTISVLYPERNEKFREIMHSLNLKWERRWVRTIGNRSGAIEDRVAEIGNKLLEAGFPVRIYDADARQKAIDGTYEPEPTRWVMARTAGDYIGWLCIGWARDEDYYAAARRIAGSRYSKPSVVVPPENYEEVMDFAAMHGFSISAAAQAVIEAARQVRGAALVSGVKVPASKGPVAIERPQLTPQETEIDEELRD